MPVAALTSPALLTTGAATPHTPVTRSPRLIAKPSLRICASSATRSLRLPTVVGVNSSLEAASSR
jgi:hypothetical protein